MRRLLVVATWAALAVLLSISATTSARKCPLLHAPDSANKTGCYIIVFHDNTTSEKASEIIQRVSQLAEGGRVYATMQTIFKGFTVKLFNFTLPMVSQ